MVTINYRDGRPIYEQVKDDLRRLVVTGAMQPGKAPSNASCSIARHQPEHDPTCLPRAGERGIHRLRPRQGSFCAQFSPQSDPRREELLARLEKRCASFAGSA